MRLGAFIPAFRCILGSGSGRWAQSSAKTWRQVHGKRQTLRDKAGVVAGTSVRDRRVAEADGSLVN